MTSIRGHTTILWSSRMAASKGSSHTLFTSQWLSRNTRTSPGEARTRMKYLTTQIKVQHNQFVKHLTTVCFALEMLSVPLEETRNTYFILYQKCGSCATNVQKESVSCGVDSGFREDSKKAGETELAFN